MENNKTPSIRFKGFTDPWEQRKVSEIGNIITGSTPKTSISDNYCGEFLFISPADIQGNRYVDETITTLTKKGFDQGRKIREGASLFVSIGSTIGKVAQTSQESTTNQQINAVEPYDNFDDDFTFTLLENISGSIKAIASNQAVPIVNKTTFGETEIQVPSELAEQQKIGEYFSNLDNLITLHQRKYNKLLNVKKSMLEKMFPKNESNIPEIRFKGFTDPWEQRKLRDIGETYTGLSGKTKADFGHGQARFVTYMNVFSNPISNLEMTEPIEIDPKQNEVEVGDVFFTTSSETPEEVGMSSVLLGKRGKTYLNSFCFGFRPSEKIDSYYLAYMLRSESAREKIILLAQGISRYNISKNKVMEIAVSLPSLDEQKQIGQYFRQLDNLITLHQRELEKLQNIKKSMLEKMFV